MKGPLLRHRRRVDNGIFVLQQCGRGARPAGLLCERFITERIEAGAVLPGTYPPNEATLAAYAEWKQTRR